MARKLTSNRRFEKAARRRIAEFWENFTNAERTALANGNPDMVQKAKDLGGDEIVAYSLALMTPQERERLGRMANKLRPMEE